MTQDRIGSAIERIDAALARIDKASDQINSNPPSGYAVEAAKGSLRGELAETLSELDTLIESLEQ